MSDDAPKPRALVFDVLKALRRACALTAPERLVLIVLADHGTHSYPSQKTIANVCNLGKSTVVRCLDSLAAKGVILRTARPPAPTRYDIVLAKLADAGQSQSGTVPERDRPGERPSQSRSGPLIVPERDGDSPGAGHESLIESLIESQRESLGAEAGASGPHSAGAKKTSKGRRTAKRASSCPASTDQSAPSWLASFGSYETGDRAGQRRIPALDSPEGAEVARFLDWHVAKGRTAADWPAAWRTWAAKAAAWASERAARSPRSHLQPPAPAGARTWTAKEITLDDIGATNVGRR